MYKIYLDKWGFTKNYTEQWAKRLLHQKKERNAVGKLSPFTKEGKAADLQRIAKYLKRMKTSLEESGRGEMSVTLYGW